MAERREVPTTSLQRDESGNSSSGGKDRDSLPDPPILVPYSYRAGALKFKDEADSEGNDTKLQRLRRAMDQYDLHSGDERDGGGRSNSDVSSLSSSTSQDALARGAPTRPSEVVETEARLARAQGQDVRAYGPLDGALMPQLPPSPISPSPPPVTPHSVPLQAQDYGGDSNLSHDERERRMSSNGHLPRANARQNSSQCGETPRLHHDQPNGNLLIHPDLLTLDMRSYRKLEEAIIQVKLFLENVQQLATDRGLVADGDGGRVAKDPQGESPCLFVTIIAGGGTAGSVLRNVLQKIFRNREIHFSEDREGVLRVDALSGLRGDDEYSRQLSNGNGQRHGNHRVGRKDLGGSGRGSSSSREMARLDNEGGANHMTQDEAISEQRCSASRTDPNPPSLQANVHSIGVVSSLGEGSFYDNAIPRASSRQVHEDDLEVQQRQISLRLQQRQLLRQQQQASQMEAQPMVSQAHYPQDHGAGMLYNPFDSIAHSLLTRDLSRNSSWSASSNTYYNALSGAPTALGRDRNSSSIPDRSDILCRQRGRNPPSLDLQLQSSSQGSQGNVSHQGHSVVQQNLPGDASCMNRFDASHSSSHHQQHLELMFPTSPREAALRAAILSRRASSPNSSSRQSPGPRPSLSGDAAHSPFSGDASDHGGFSRPRRSRGSCGDHDMHRAVVESQATHIAHTRRQVESDIQFRRAMELASTESTMEIQQIRSRRINVASLGTQLNGDGRGDGFVSANLDTAPEAGGDDDQLIQVATRRSILDEQNRKLEAKRIFEAELEVAMRQSEQHEEAKLQEEEKLKLSEEDLIQDLLVKTGEEEEEERRKEDEILKKALALSLVNEENVDEDELLEDAVKKSLSESQQGNSGDENTEEILEQVMRLSLEEEGRAAKEEEEQLKKAVEWSILEHQSACHDAATDHDAH